MEAKKLQTVTDKREYGIDFVKIIAAFLVVLTHLFTFGGFKENLEVGTVKYFCAIFIQGISLCCVNLFGLSTGYLCFKKKAKLSKVFSLWIQVVFLSLIVLLAFVLINKDISLIKLNLIQVILPIASGKFWFFNAYIALFLFVNFYNKCIESISKKEFLILLASMFVLFVAIPLYTGKDSFKTNKGYSFVWLTFLYFAGAYIKKYNIINKVKSWLCGLICVALISLIPLYGCFNASHQIKFLDGDYSEIATNYNSIPIAVASILIFLIITKIKINTDNKIFKKIITLFSSASFAVYIIHCNPFVFEGFICDKLAYYSDYSVGHMIGVILLRAFIIFVCCSLLGIVQAKVFEWLKVNKFCNRVEDFIDKIFNKFCREE
ncbi:MAG: acyltransferase [Clostridia bacterium]|nr:acyltransferase [Clostridia bacterium]